MKYSPQDLKTRVPLLEEGIVGPNRDPNVDCYCIPFWWHGGCTGTFYDPAFKEISEMYASELDYMARKLLGFSSTTPVSSTQDEPEVKLWAMTFRTILPAIATLEGHIMAKGFILSYADARHLLPEETNRLLVLADCLLMAKIMGLTWQEVLDNKYLSIHSVMDAGVLSTEFVQFIHTVREFIADPSGDFDEARLMEVYEAAEKVFKSIEDAGSSSISVGDKSLSKEQAEGFMKSMVKDTLAKIKAAMGDQWEEIQKNVGKSFDDLLGDEDEF